MKRLIALILLLLMGTAMAEGDNCWVVCQPEDYINIRKSPSRRSEITGWSVSGMGFETDWVERNGFMHIVGVTEYGDGWISSAYLVYDEPVGINDEAKVIGNARVACRRSIDGKRRCWLKPGSTVTVYWWSTEWAVTDKGFIRSEYLDYDKE